MANEYIIEPHSKNSNYHSHLCLSLRLAYVGGRAVVRCLLRGNPITVWSAPFGLPRFGIRGGSFICLKSEVDS